MVNKIIFLDIDGPMIPAVSYLEDKNASFKQLLDSRSVRLLTEIINRSGAKIVFNSYHNKVLGPSSNGLTPGLIKRFEDVGLLDAIHETKSTKYPYFVRDRLLAIHEWLHQFGEEGDLWVALDDQKIDHKRAYTTSFDDGIGMGEFNHCAKWLQFKGCNVW